MRLGARFWRRFGVGAVTLALLTGCAGDSTDETGGSEAAISSARALDASALTHPLHKAMVQGTHGLSPEAFEAKWRASLSDGALMFLRAYPAAFHLDLAQLPRNRVPGGEGICVGDAHPDNFGYLHVDGAGGRTPIYAFNDLDDSGQCLIALDALRYFVAFRLYFDDADDDGKLEESIEHYVDELFDDEARSPIDAAWKEAKDDAPDWDAVRDEALNKYVSGDAFRADLDEDDLLPVDGTQKTAVVAALAGAPSTAGLRVLDVAQRPRVAGGSGGLTRYWALTSAPNGSRTILELKETARPGVEFGSTRARFAHDERLPVLKEALWDVTVDGDYFTVSIGTTQFLVRDRARKASAKPKGKLREAQAEYLGALHRGGWGALKKSEVREWLHASSKVIAKRWEKFYEAERRAVE